MILASRRIVALLALVFTLLGVAPVVADVAVPRIIGSHMVLQRDLPVLIWGWAAPGEEVTVEFAGQKLAAKADEAGRWSVNLAPLKAGGPHEMTIAGKNTVKLDNILVGEVWVCSGQSNMGWSLGQVNDAEREVAAADHPRIRLFECTKIPSAQPLADTDARWQVCTPDTIKGFTAVGYYFGRELQQALDVPIGLINTSWGGTRIEPWTPAAAFDDAAELAEIRQTVEQAQAKYAKELQPLLPALEVWLKAAKAAAAAGKPVPPTPALPPSRLNMSNQPTSLYNGMVAPVVPFAMRGAIWYQGESNVGEGMLYLAKMKALIAGWRQAWRQGDFPFYYVQLAPYRHGRDALALPRLWEAQTAALAIPDTGMAVTTDIGTPGDVHPKNKLDVGKRLALWALAKTYGHERVVCSGPLYKSMQVEGDKIRIAFDHVGSGLASRDGEPLSHFQIAGADRKFVDAAATIDGDTVVVRSADVKQPVAVRFGWNQVARPNLMNKEHLPASPFRTDRWD